MKDLEAQLARWVEAGLVTEEQAGAIRADEGARAVAPEARTSLLADRVSGPFAWHVPGIVRHAVDLDSLGAAAR